MIVVFIVLLFVEAEGEGIGGFVVSVEGVDKILTPNSVIFRMIVESADAGDFVPGFLSDRVVKDDVAVLGSARFSVFLKLFKPFVVKLLFVPVILGEELVESTFATGWKNLACDARHGLVAGRNKTCGVGFRVTALSR